MRIHNGATVPLSEVPLHSMEELREQVLEATESRARLAALFGEPRDGEATRLYAILAHGDEGTLSVLCADVGDRYPSLTPDCPQAHWFEREIAEQWGVVPEGHPWLKPIRFHRCYPPGRDAWGRDPATAPAPGVTDFFRVEGDGVHEVAVGPVHAGVIEPGHFRFQCDGALAGDVGYLPTASYCGRIRGDYLNMTALLCGSRFGRGLVRPGGTGFDLDHERKEELERRLTRALADVTGATSLLWTSPSVMARFESTGPVSREACEDLGLVGTAARACGVTRDVRHEFPSGLFRFAQIPVSTWHTGDVFGRAHVRWQEIQRSTVFIREQIRALPGGATRAELGPLAPERIAVSLVEGWRGEICHVALTDAQGRFAAYKVVDSSFHNWMGLALALRGQEISDFPLCNKSFNLSYCGHDL
jgi:Ni,Fe-hydrogenase III large subunit